MILTRSQIQERIKSGQVAFSPALDAFQDQPHAVDLRLGTHFYLPQIWKQSPRGREIITVDTNHADQENFTRLELELGQYFELAPGETVIASTYERLSLRDDHLMGVLYPRSSLTRRGLSLDLTGIVDAHYEGHLMIPVLNKTTTQIIRLYPGERLCQLVLQQLSAPLSSAEAQRHGVEKAKYQGADAVQLEGRPDSTEEQSLIAQGKLESLKEQYPYGK